MTRRRRFAAGLLAAFVLAGCSRAAPQPEPSPALWEVTGPHGEHGYLFGTIHALPRGMRWDTPRVDAAFASSSRLAVEARGIDSPSEMNAVFERLARTPGLPPLTARVPADKRALVSAALAGQGLDDGDFAGVETWAAAVMLGNAYETGDSANGVDRALLRAADGKQVVELEGVEPQLRIFDDLPEQEQAALLVAIAGEAAEGEQARARQVDDWLTGRVDALANEADRQMLADPGLRRALLTGRNDAWAERITQLLEQPGTLFVAVGAAHVIGPDGLAVLLAERGYAVKRIE